MRILISGGAGFIGSNLALSLQDEHEILIIDKMQGAEHFENGNLKSLGHFKNLLDFHGSLFVADICDEIFLEKIKDFKPDVIFHKAAISDTTVYNQNEVLKTNLNNFEALIKLCIDLNIKLIYASSASVYGDAKSPQTVDVDEKPKNPYAFSKLMMDRLCQRYEKELHIVGLRYFNVYGEGEFYKGKTASTVLQFALQILSNKAPRLFEGSDKIYRDFVYIKDVVNANLMALDAKSGIYNVGSGVARSFQDIADILQKELETNFACEYFANPYTKNYQFHTQAKLDKSFAYEPKFSLESGISSYLTHIKLFAKENNA